MDEQSINSPENISFGRENLNQDQQLSLMNDFISGMNDLSIKYSSFDDGNKKTIFSTNIKLLAGYTSEEINDLPSGELSLVHDDDREFVEKYYYSLANDKSKIRSEIIYRLVKKDGKIIWLKEHQKIQKDDSGKVKFILSVLSDITGIKEESESIKSKNVQLEKNNLDKDKFISILSHELRSPFTSILGFCEILINDQNLSKEDKAEYLNFIYNASKTQLQLINYLLDWSKLKTGSTRFEPRRLNARNLIYKCVSAFTGDAIRKNIEIKVEADNILYLQADERLISIVLNNLVSNAIKYSNEGKVIEVTADSFNDEFVEFTVADEGIGISEEDKHRLFGFEKMFCTEGTRGEKGTGLGLALSKEIVEQFNGKLWFYSEPGKGSEFHFTIPASPNTILIVESNPEDLDTLKKLVKNKLPEYQVVGAENGYKAMEVISYRFPSLIIANHDIPLLSGIQLIKMIRKKDEYFNIPIVAVSEDFSEELKDSYRKFGIKDLFTKPVDQENLGRYLQSMIN